MMLLALLALAGPPCHTSTRHVRAIEFDAQGRALISTTGGRLVADPQGHFSKWTEAAGLANHDLPAAKLEPFAQGPPLSLGTHVVGEVKDPGGRTVALFGDRYLWRWDGERWQLGPLLPPDVDDATLLKRQGKDLWLGTRRHGAWRYRDGQWTSFLGPNEPRDHNAQAMAEFKDELWVSTLEDGLQVFGNGQWRNVTTPDISTPAPRDLVVYRGSLWVRHGDGQIDFLHHQGQWFKKVLWTELPRKQATRLVTDGNRLYIGQWGGWSEYDQTWTHHFPPELTGVPVTAIAPTKDGVWIGTQGKGLFFFGKQVTRYGDVQGLPDDWITAIHVEAQTVTVGTFVGGAAVLRDGRFVVIPGTPGTTITALGPELIVSGRGIRRKDDSTWRSPSEAQCFGVYHDQLWVGGRRGIYRP